MKLLLDTHFAFWLIADPGRLRPVETSLIEGNDVAVSAVSIWEFRLKWGLRFASGARKGPVDPAVLLSALRQRALTLLPLTPEGASAVLTPPLDHSDPFDVLLLTQAQQGGYRLLTRDAKLAPHPIALLAR